MSGRRYQNDDESGDTKKVNSRQYPLPDYATNIPYLPPPSKQSQRDSDTSYFSTYSGKVESVERVQLPDSPLRLVAAEELFDQESQSDTSSVKIGKLPTVTSGSQGKESDYHYNTPIEPSVPARSSKRPPSELTSSIFQAELDRELARDSKSKRTSIADDLEMLMLDAKSIGDDNNDSLVSASTGILKHSSSSPRKSEIEQFPTPTKSRNQKDTFSRPITVKRSPVRLQTNSITSDDLQNAKIYNADMSPIQSTDRSTGDAVAGSGGSKHNRVRSEPINMSPSDVNSKSPSKQDNSKSASRGYGTIKSLDVSPTRYKELNQEKNRESFSKQQTKGKSYDLENPSIDANDEGTTSGNVPMNQPLRKQKQLPPRPTAENISRAREVSNANKARVDLFGIEDTSDFSNLPEPNLLPSTPSKSMPELEIDVEGHRSLDPELSHIYDQKSDISNVEKNIINPTSTRNANQKSSPKEDDDDDYYDIGNPVFVHNSSTKPQKDKKKKKARRYKQNKELKPFSYSTLVSLLESMNGTVIGEEFSQLNLPIKEKQLIEKIMDSLSRLTTDMVIDSDRYEVGIERLEKALRALEGFL